MDESLLKYKDLFEGSDNIPVNIPIGLIVPLKEQKIDFNFIQIFEQFLNDNISADKIQTGDIVDLKQEQLNLYKVI